MHDSNLPPNTAAPIHLSAQVKQALELYFAQLKDYEPADLYNLVLGEVEKPLLAAVLEKYGYNQTKAAKVLGLSRSTLRKKLEQYGLLADV
jgi:Fis family transcriptional regulator, factor for inversion stimulation protein